MDHCAIQKISINIVEEGQIENKTTAVSCCVRNIFQSEG